MLTLGRYAHVRLADLRKALPTVPTTPPASEPHALRMTGTDANTSLSYLTQPDSTAPLMHQTSRDSLRIDASRCGEGAGPKLAGNSRETLKNTRNGGKLRSHANMCMNAGGGSRTHTPLRATDFESAVNMQNTGKTNGLPQNCTTNAPNRTSSAPNSTISDDPALMALASAWPTLPPVLKAGILAMVKAAMSESKVEVA